MIARVLLICALPWLSACAVGDYVADLLEGEANIEPPAPLTEIETTLEIETLWSTTVGRGVEKQFLKLTPVAAGDLIFTADRKGTVSAVNAQTGKLVWKQDTEQAISGGPGIGEGAVLLGTSEAEVLALSQEDGHLVWKSAVTSEVLAAPRAAEGVAVARTVDGKLFGFDASDGQRLWVYDRQVPALTLRGTSAPVLVNGLAVTGFDNGSLVALELKTGKPVWEVLIAQPRGRSDLERMVDIDAEPLVIDGTLYVAAFQRGVAAMSLESGRISWERDVSSYAGIAADPGNVYVSDDQGHVWALDRYTGSSVWKQEKLHARALSAPATIGDYVVVGDFEGYLHWMRRDDGEIVARVRVDKSRIIAPPFVENDTLFAYSSDGTLGAYRPK